MNAPAMKSSFCSDPSLGCIECEFCPAPTQFPTAAPTFSSTFQEELTVNTDVDELPQTVPASELPSSAVGQDGEADTDTGCITCAGTTGEESHGGTMWAIIGVVVVVLLAAGAVVVTKISKERIAKETKNSKRLAQFGSETSSDTASDQHFETTTAAGSRYLV
jgi:hypothetical protein